jgi:hypothetical protein
MLVLQMSSTTWPGPGYSWNPPEIVRDIARRLGHAASKRSVQSSWPMMHTPQDLQNGRGILTIHTVLLRKCWPPTPLLPAEVAHEKTHKDTDNFLVTVGAGLLNNV